MALLDEYIKTVLKRTHLRDIGIYSDKYTVYFGPE
jgi:hypothetical protein